jgi:hypothetical protein
MKAKKSGACRKYINHGRNKAQRSGINDGGENGGRHRQTVSRKAISLAQRGILIMSAAANIMAKIIGMPWRQHGERYQSKSGLAAAAAAAAAKAKRSAALACRRPAAWRWHQQLQLANINANHQLQCGGISAKAKWYHGYNVISKRRQHHQRSMTAGVAAGD